MPAFPAYIAPRSGRTVALVLGLLGLTLSLLGCDLGATPTPAPPTVPPVPTELVRGAVHYANYCQICHPGGQRGIGPQLIGIRDSDARIKAVIRSGVSNMPAFDSAHISDADLQSLVDYIRSLK